jgi:hypothetical protein
MTTREIGAYFCGRRLADYWLDHEDTSEPSRDWVLGHIAGEDAEVYKAMKPRRFWYWFDFGWDENLIGRGRW